MRDTTPRIVKVLDAVSQMANVAFLPNHTDTHANESISGRSHRCGWRIRHAINALFFWQNNHCLQSHLKDLDRAYETLLAHAETREAAE